MPSDLKYVRPDAVESESPRERSRGGLKVVLRLAVAAVIVGLLIRAIGAENVLARIKVVPTELAIAAFVLMIVAHAVAGFELRLLAKSQGFTLRRSEATFIQLSSVFYGLFVPGGSATAWAVRVVRLTRGTKRISPALQLVAGERALATASGAWLGVLASAVVASKAAALVGTLLLGVAVASTALCAVLFTSSLAMKLRSLACVPVLGRLVKKIAVGDSSLHRPGLQTIGLATMMSLGSHLVGVVAWIILAGAMGIALHPFEVAWVYSASMVTMMIPGSIGGLGLREGTVVSLMGAIGAAASDALAWSLAVFACTVFAVGLVGGLVEACWLNRRFPMDPRSA